MSTTSSGTAPTTTPAPAPIAAILDFLGAANVQKLIGLVGGPVIAVDFKTWTAKLAAIGTGSVFALGVHFVDWLRTK